MRAPTRASTASRRAPGVRPAVRAASAHNISRYRTRGCEGAGRHGAIDDDLPVGRDVPPGRGGSTSRNGESAKKTARLAAAGRRQLRAGMPAAPRVLPPLDDHQRERDGQEHAVVVRRERDAAGRARHQRVALPWTVRARARPHPRHRQVREHDRQRRRHIVLHVVGVAHVQRGRRRGRPRPRSRCGDRSGAPPARRARQSWPCLPRRRAPGRQYRCRSDR